MANVIELITKYLPMLDEQYRLGAKSAVLDVPVEFIQMTKEAKKVKIAKIFTDKLANYSRGSGFVNGDTDLTWEEHEFRIDRGRSLSIDTMDNVETMGLAWGRLAGTFQREAVIPEIDAYRFAQYFQKAGLYKAVELSTSNILDSIDELSAKMDDREVPEEGRFIFVEPMTYKLLVNDSSISKFLDVSEEYTKALNKKIYSYNGMPIVKVPSSRFYKRITLLDGTTSGQEAGGFSGEGEIKLMIISLSAVVQISKRNISRFWAPNREAMAVNGADGVNPSADAWKFDFRIYHDAWVLDNKLDGIAVIYKPVNSLTISDATASVAVGATKTLTVTVAPTDADVKDIVFSSSDEAVCTVSKLGVVTGVAAGSAVVTATAVDGSGKTATCTVTVA